MSFFFLDSELFSFTGKLQPRRDSLNSCSHVGPPELLRICTSPSFIYGNSWRWVRATRKGCCCREQSHCNRCVHIHSETMSSADDVSSAQGAWPIYTSLPHPTWWALDMLERAFWNTKLPLKAILFSSWLVFFNNFLLSMPQQCPRATAKGRLGAKMQFLFMPKLWCRCQINQAIFNASHSLKF